MKIAYLYYDILNLYGDSGNIKIIDRILKENKIKHEILYLSLDDELNFEDYDLVYIGSGTENNIKIVMNHLKKYQKDIKNYIENNKHMLITGNSIFMFGRELEKDKGLNIFDYNVLKVDRIKNEVFIKSLVFKKDIIGFENTCYKIDKLENTLFENEGIYYKNFIGTHIIGPILVRNPEFLKFFMNNLTNKKLKYDLKLEMKAYDNFVNMEG